MQGDFILSQLSIGCLESYWTVYTGCFQCCWSIIGSSWSVRRVFLLYLNCLLGDKSLFELCNGCIEFCWTVTGYISHLYAGWFYSIWTVYLVGWFYSIWTVYWVSRVFLNCILVVLNVAELTQALADLYKQCDFTLCELSIGWLQS